jgi:hypothetical protein
MEHVLMPTLLERIAQLGCSTRKHNENCRRKVCRRYGYCMPLREQDHAHLYRCPYDLDDLWFDRAAAVGKVCARLMKVAETRSAARGLPSPFAPRPVPDHLDLSKPLDVAALLAPLPKAE